MIQELNRARADGYGWRSSYTTRVEMTFPMVVAMSVMKNIKMIDLKEFL